MMMKIKNIKHLQKKKRQLKQREKELMGQIKADWRHLKHELSFRNLFGEQLWNGKYYGQRSKDESILKKTLSFAATLLVRKLMNTTTVK